MNPAKKERIKELYLNNQSITEISEILNIPQATIYYHIKKTGINRSAKDGLKIAKDKGKIYKTPQIIANLDSFLKEYNTKSLTEIATEYGIAKYRLSALLKENSIEQKSWNKQNRQLQNIRFEENYPKLNDKKYLQERYLELGSAGRLADEIGVSITAVRNRFKKFDIKFKKDNSYKTGFHSSRGRSIKYKGDKSSKAKTFRSILECGFAMLLDQDPLVSSWEYEYIKYSYFDGFTGKQKIYICDFYIDREEKIEQVEVKPLDQQFPLDKYLYAKNCMPGWRWITKVEAIKSYELFKSGYKSNSIQFMNKLPKTKYYNWYSINPNEEFHEPWRIKMRSRFGEYYIYRIVNDKLDHRIAKSIDLNLDKILDCVKDGKTQKNIAKELGVDPRTIRDFIERNSYTVRWGKKREVRHATKLIWTSTI